MSWMSKEELVGVRRQLTRLIDAPVHRIRLKIIIWRAPKDCVAIAVQSSGEIADTLQKRARERHLLFVGCWRAELSRRVLAPNAADCGLSRIEHRREDVERRELRRAGEVHGKDVVSRVLAFVQRRFPSQGHRSQSSKSSGMRIGLGTATTGCSGSEST